MSKHEAIFHEESDFGLSIGQTDYIPVETAPQHLKMYYFLVILAFIIIFQMAIQIKTIGQALN